MKRYSYYANIKGVDINAGNIHTLVEKINTILGLPLVSTNSLYNFFTRPDTMKNRVGVFNMIELHREPFISSKNGVQ